MEQLLKTKQTSFWEIITNNTIIIPQIQRDYAQGREDKDVKEIRTKILDKFYYAIKMPSKIDIDFIYGYNVNNLFIPLDGQQRLTTLFLIHWYILKRIGSQELNALVNFRYETRQSSTDFCKALLESEINPETVTDLQEWIIDQRWFFHSWKKDPTVIAMLTMIQSIHLKFNGNDFNKLWKNICTSTPITFNFLSIENSGLNDELYIKMNSRGKPLSRFENFKVWFEKKYPENTDWKKKIDNEWTNLFWKFKNVLKTDNNHVKTIDDGFMQFINGMLMYEIALQNLKDEVQFFANTSEIVLSKYETKEFNCFTPAQVQQIAKTLDWVAKQNHEINDMLKDIFFWQEKSVFEAFISNKLTYTDRTRFYCIVHFINQVNEGEFNHEYFHQWIRVTRNLIENTTIDSPETFIDAIKSITALNTYALNIYDYLRTPDCKISFFLNAQVEEEKHKAQLIKKDNNWQSIILNTENHELFRGCIGFLLSNLEDNTIEAFEIDRMIAQSLFDKNGSKQEFKNEYLLVRVILAKSSISRNIRLIDNGENWRTLLKHGDIQNSVFQIIKEMASIRPEEYKDYLEQIIDNFNNKDVLWKYYLIKNKVLLSPVISRSKFIKLYEDRYYLFNNEGGNWINNDNQILLSNYRNELIDLLLDYSDEIKLYHYDDWHMITDLTTNNKFYRGYRVWLKKEIGNYQLTFEFTPAMLVIGFSEDYKDIIEVIPNEWYKVVNYLVAALITIPNTEENLQTCFDLIKERIGAIEKMVKLK